MLPRDGIQGRDPRSEEGKLVGRKHLANASLWAKREVSVRPFLEIGKDESQTKFELSERNFLIKNADMNEKKEVNIHHDNE